MELSGSQKNGVPEETPGVVSLPFKDMEGGALGEEVAGVREISKSPVDHPHEFFRRIDGCGLCLVDDDGDELLGGGAQAFPFVLPAAPVARSEVVEPPHVGESHDGECRRLRTSAFAGAETGVSGIVVETHGLQEYHRVELVGLRREECQIFREKLLPQLDFGGGGLMEGVVDDPSEGIMASRRDRGCGCMHGIVDLARGAFFRFVDAVGDQPEESIIGFHGLGL